MTTTPNDRRPPSPMRRWIGFTIALIVISLIGSVVTTIAGYAFVLGGAVCGHDETRLICTTTGEHIVFWLPWAGWAGAIVASLVVASRAVRRSREPWSGLAVGAAIYVVCLVIAYSIATS
jgi:hypothetical protein